MNPYLIPDNDIEFDVKDFLHYIVKRWLSVIIAGLIVAGILIGYKIYKTRSISDTVVAENGTETTVKNDIEAENLKNEYIAESELYAYAIADLQENVVDQNKYLQHSTLMKINPYNVPTTSVTFIINAENNDKTLAKLIAYEFRNELLEGDYLKKLSVEVGVEDVQYIKELIDVNTETLSKTGVSGMSDGTESVLDADNDEQLQSLDSVSEDDPMQKIARYGVSIVAIGQDLNQSSKIIDGILAEVGNINKKLSKKYKYTIDIGEKHTFSLANDNLVARQNTFYERINWTKTTRATVESNSKGLVKVPEEVEVEAGSPSVSKKTLVKYGTVGFIVGVFLLIVWYFLRFITNNRLISYKDLSRRFCLHDMGSYDKTELSVEMIAVNISTCVKQTQKVLLLGTVNENLIRELTDKIHKTDNSLQISCGGNILIDPQARRKLLIADIVILVEKKGVSRYSDIQCETEILSGSNKKIAGIIVC